MPEGLSPSEVGEHIERRRRRDHADDEQTGRDRLVTIIEASLLAIVALLAAWSGYAAAKWSTESRIVLAESSSSRLQANRAVELDADDRAFDSSTFNTWFTAYVAANETAADTALRRFRPEFKVAFDAWLATDPFTNADAPPGPTYMPEYARPHRDDAERLDSKADELFAKGSQDAEDADRYVRITVFLATVLFLVGISGHFRVRLARYGLVGVSAAILVVAVVFLIVSPKPPLF
jgi:hypothetical protein